ncbi:hypothetical protein SLA2020_190680 [Shorea laevis]
MKITEERWRTDPWWLKTSKVYSSDGSEFDECSDDDSGQFSDRWSLPSDEEVDQPTLFEKDPLNEVIMKPTIGGSSQRNIALGSVSASMGRNVEESIEGSMSENSSGNHELPSLNSSPPLDARNGVKRPNDHSTPNSTLQAHTNPNQDTTSLCPVSYPANPPAQKNPDENPQHPSICFQNHENPRFVIGLH